MTRKTRSMQAIDKHVGHKIKWHRIQRGLSQDDLASQLGISYQQLHKYENGSNSTSASRLSEIASGLQVSVADFFSGYGDDEKSHWVNEHSNREQLLLAKYYNQIRHSKDRQAVDRLIRALADDGMFE